jgi:hypothetical protein
MTLASYPSIKSQSIDLAKRSGKTLEEPDNGFKELMDNLILSAENDRELKNGLKLIDNRAWTEGVGFYEMAEQILLERIMENRGKMAKNPRV